ncbi:transporter [Parasediminibacterium sp. JCM 36343]|uniref:transporter n=1 Tax=Parasediminibacterium sp. JCM 36343 TaxID=3374279 RepID=UPI003977EA0B
MKKNILILICIFISFNNFACPICGCGGGNLYMGLMPDFKSKFLGFRYHYAGYHTQLADDPTQFSTNHYNIVELWGGFNINKKLRLMAFVPYYINRQIDDDGIANPHGFGDITIMAQYNVWGSSKLLKNNKVLKQQLWLGGGIKLPTGCFKVNTADSNTTVADINAQLGTGSTDFILNGLYSLQVGKIGANISANYKLNTVNSDNYKYGNKFTGNVITFYQLNKKHLYIIPNLGIGYETTHFNELQKATVAFTGSRLLTYIAGVELSYKSVGFGINAQLPASQDFAEGQTDMRFKAMAHISYSF